MSGGIVAVLADFGNGMGMTRSPRDVRRVDIEMIPELREEGPRLGPRPQLLHRVSPLADAKAPTRAEDTAPGQDHPFEWTGGTDSDEVSVADGEVRGMVRGVS